MCHDIKKNSRIRHTKGVKIVGKLLICEQLMAGKFQWRIIVLIT
ncbi:hypothetical protein HanRHA438_Chr13g0591241 [Helianthus annuus]|nr:hypothetical protein HanRHA438_Chr13g0591241 [Helianthus annuus]